MSARLTVWTVFHSPSDYPGKWVVRGFNVSAGGPQPLPDCLVADTLDQARAAIPPGLARMIRHPDDDPVIYETWV